jgi:hypothetical protein
VFYPRNGDLKMFDWNEFEDTRAVPLHVTDNVNYTRFNMDYKYGEDRRAKRNAWNGTERRNDADWRFAAIRKIRRV